MYIFDWRNGFDVSMNKQKVSISSYLRFLRSLARSFSKRTKLRFQALNQVDPIMKH
ncbi:hypothetical protein OAV88_02680 [bacterium]|nr:hypothetical protein [bacterium]